MDVPQEDHLPSSKTTPKRRRRNKGMCLEDRPVLEPNAAGIDVGAREMFVAVPPGRDKNPVRVFATFTEDLDQCYAEIPSGPHLIEMLLLTNLVSPRERMKKARLSWQKILLSKLPVVPS